MDSNAESSLSPYIVEVHCNQVLGINAHNAVIDSLAIIVDHLSNCEFLLHIPLPTELLQHVCEEIDIEIVHATYIGVGSQCYLCWPPHPNWP